MSVNAQFIREKFDTLLLVAVFLIVLTLWYFTGKVDELLQLARDFGTAILVLTGVRRLTPTSASPDPGAVQATATLKLDHAPAETSGEPEAKPDA